MSNNFWENECHAANRLAVAQSKRIAELEEKLLLIAESSYQEAEIESDLKKQRLEHNLIVSYQKEAQNLLSSKVEKGYIEYAEAIHLIESVAWLEKPNK